MAKRLTRKTVALPEGRREIRQGPASYAIAGSPRDEGRGGGMRDAEGEEPRPYSPIRPIAGILIAGRARSTPATRPMTCSSSPERTPAEMPRRP